MSFSFIISIVMNIITLSIQRTLLNFKSLGSNLVTLFLLFIIPTLFCFSAVIVTPLGFDFQLIISGTVMLIGYITYGSIAGSFRRSTLNKNSNMTAAVKWTDNLATIATMIILSVLVVLYTLCVLALLEITGTIKWDFTNTSSDAYVNILATVGIINIMYNTLIITMITYSTSYLFQGFFDSDMMFFTLAIMMLVLLMVLGATFNSYFYYSAREGMPVYMEETIAFGPSFFYPSLLFPFYAPAQMLVLQGNFLTNQMDFLLHPELTLIHPEPNSMDIWTFMSGAGSFKWNILWFVPYFHIVFWWTLGFLYKKFGTPVTAQ